MSPSLAGYPAILSEICALSSPPTLSRLLRVDRQLFDIAGRHLYRRHVFKAGSYDRISPQPFETYITALSEQANSWEENLEQAPLWQRSFIYPLLDHIEVLEISENNAIQLSNRCRDPNGPFLPRLSRLKTLIVLANYHDPERLTLREPFLPDWCPERLVILGSVKALYRVTSYRRTAIGYRRTDGPGNADMLWPSVTRLKHIIPHIENRPYPSDFLLRTDPCDVTASLPNIRNYDLFFDIRYHQRQTASRQMDRSEHHFARTMAWLIRNSREDLAVTIWLSAQTQQSLDVYKSLIKATVCRPYSPKVLRALDQPDDWYPVWDDAQFGRRVDVVRAARCEESTEEAWCKALDNVWRNRMIQSANEPDSYLPWLEVDLTLEGEEGAIDWCQTHNGETGTDLEFSDIDDEDEEDEDDEDEDCDEESDCWNSEDSYYQFERHKDYYNYGPYDNGYSEGEEDNEW